MVLVSPYRSDETSWLSLSSCSGPYPPSSCSGPLSSFLMFRTPILLPQSCSGPLSSFLMSRTPILLPHVPYLYSPHLIFARRVSRLFESHWISPMASALQTSLHVVVVNEVVDEKILVTHDSDLSFIS